MKIRVSEYDWHILNMWTRMPFRYGIATLTALPHLFLRVVLEIDGRTTAGIAADGLAPKWFTKDPQRPVELEVTDMLEVIRVAAESATRLPAVPSVFRFWKDLYDRQAHWGATRQYPPLLWHFGVSLVERAVIDAFCRAQRCSFPEALRTNQFGIVLSAVHPELGQTAPSDYLPRQPLAQIQVRHTIGLADALTEADIPAEQRITDGLPQSLEAAIQRYRLTHFKIKVPADPAAAVDRLKRIASVIQSHVPAYRFTLDGNEFFTELDPFQKLWHSLQEDAAVRRFFDTGLLFVEQPLHRNRALSDEVARAFRAWPDRPPIIIDESDGELSSLPRALEIGYAGTSHKNCKGVLKGVANACLISRRRAAQPLSRLLFSGEDLANVGPIALLQDLAVAASLGIEHVERNGHHYFAGLSAFPEDIQASVLDRHSDLYHTHQAGSARFPSLTIRDGYISTRTLLTAPFGYASELDPGRYIPVSQWQFSSLQKQG